MRRNSGMMAMFLCAVLFGSLLAMQALCILDQLFAYLQVVLSYWPVPGGLCQCMRENEDIVVCMAFRCNFFSPNGTCFCCTGTGRKEYCFLTYTECRATCDFCKPPKFT
ncbi:hypothetical protein SETIT_5G151400v2 [Setaria italica]|uniref:Embryo surrounding factor 1 brassicaceae domain-containing protein n=1 Tax=Setaria italica TaxID=4555 RepID=A0A368R535_SETIT|nr:hypothetical protein SETIT_5G151400v2 [Setaria italica]